MYPLVRCAGCARGGLAIIHSHAQNSLMAMGHFYPASVDIARIPAVVPDELIKELRSLREAELCAAYGHGELARRCSVPYRRKRSN
jgi:hypothetical protein